MFRTTTAVLMMSTALVAGSAFAQSTTTTPSTSAPMVAPATSAPAMAAAPSGGFVTQQGTGEFLASKFIGLDIYGSENQKIGDIKQIIIDGNGQAKTIVIGVGGFLGIGEKSVGVAWSAVEWKLDRPMTTASTAPATPGGSGSMGSASPTTTASTAPARSPAEQAAYNGYPDHGMIKMSKADLQGAPTFKYVSDTTSSSGSATTNAPARQ